MKASKLVQSMGASLVGREVLTAGVGEYPGGEAVVTELHPDPGAPEIVFNVRHPSVGVIGVFDHEPVELL